ncbi:MAG: hypothetical protein K0U38_11460 [Epsilonproteobacteria bacterium]|nr:hypothetical protein [Campylobacterota bacterium]
MKKTILISLIGITSLFANEPSVYGAGNIDSAEPYGLTATEKNVLENRKQVQFLKNRVAEQQNRINGLTTVIEGLNRQILDLKENLGSNTQAEDYNKTYSLLLDLGTMIDQINNNYVTQEDLQTALRGGAIKSSSGTTRNSVSTDVSTVYREGVQLFGRKSYNAARAKFEQALSNSYKPAASNYYLGEIAYYTDDYSSAVSYFKKSASLYDKASYMKVLYLHTAIALSRSGQQDQARGFFQYVIDNYPGTKAAQIAKKNL